MARTRRSRASATALEAPERSGPPAPLARGAWRLPLVTVVLAWALLFLPQLLLGQRFALGDSSAFRPFSDFSRARWHETHQRTYWNPYVFMGIESVASLADQRPQYLPDALLDLTERLGEPRPSPQLWLLFTILAGVLAVVALARRLWDADPWSAAAGGLIWLLAVPILFPLAYGHDAQVLADALLPVLVLATWAMIAADHLRLRLGGALALALALGIQCLHGHPQILVYSAALILLFALQQAWTLGRWRRLVPWAAAVALGTAIGAAAWWPALLYGALSSRGSGDAQGVALEVVAKYSLGWRDLLSLAWPRAVGFGDATYWGGLQVTDYPPYLGAVALTLALAGLRRGSARDGATQLFWWGTLIAAVAFSLGTTLGPAFEFLHRHVPLWSHFRVPFYVMIWACLALALLVARGLARAGAGSQAPVDPRLARGALVAAGLAVLAGLAVAFPLAPQYASLAAAARSTLEPPAARAAALSAGLDLAGRAILVAIAVALLLRMPAGRRWAQPLLVLLVALDLATVGVPALWRSTAPRSGVAPPPPPALARAAAATPRLRAYAGAARPVVDERFPGRSHIEAYTNFWVSWRARCLTGNHGAFPAVWRTAMAYQLTRYRPVLAAWGVGWLDLDRPSPDSLPGLTRAGGDDHATVWRLDGAPGRAHAVTEVVALADVDAVARALATPGFDPGGVAVTTDASAAGSYPGSARCAIRWLADEPERLELEVSAPDRAFVVIADSDFPGWSARVDGVEAPISPVDLLVRGVTMPAGRHRLELRYETPGMRAAVPVTRAGLGAWVVLALAWGAVAARGGRKRLETGA